MLDEFLLFVAVGVAAQLIDGAIGMGHGLIAMTVLMSLGIAPAAASASVHVAEVVTTGASGVAHWWFGNVDRNFALRLAFWGAIGGTVGAQVLVVAPLGPIILLVSVYLFAMGCAICWKAFQRRRGGVESSRLTAALGLAGGFFDALGGGGWGPIVTSTLIGRGISPRLAIGTSIAAEFFVATAISLTFIMTIGAGLWMVILGLVLGGVIAAPFAAFATRHLPDRTLMVLVGLVIMVLSCRQFLMVFQAD